MRSAYDINGLVGWDEEAITIRENMVGLFTVRIDHFLRSLNPAIATIRCEMPILTPRSMIDKGYGDDDVWAFPDDDLVLRPETTPGSYRWAQKVVLNGYEKPKYKLPVCVWQHGKSFRREQDKVTRHVRLKEFYQLEYQLIYPHGTAMDYPTAMHEYVREMLASQVGPCRLEESDRLPSYSERTVDVICNENGMEVCSMSTRTDFPGAKVLEVAIGTDRCVYCFMEYVL